MPPSTIESRTGDHICGPQVEYPKLPHNLRGTHTQPWYQRKGVRFKRPKHPLHPVLRQVDDGGSCPLGSCPGAVSCTGSPTGAASQLHPAACDQFGTRSSLSRHALQSSRHSTASVGAIAGAWRRQRPLPPALRQVDGDGGRLAGVHGAHVLDLVVTDVNCG